MEQTLGAYSGVMADTEAIEACQYRKEQSFAAKHDEDRR
jgi:hypothetical protein